jgi:dienelactone hydrolase
MKRRPSSKSKSAQRLSRRDLLDGASAGMAVSPAAPLLSASGRPGQAAASAVPAPAAPAVAPQAAENHSCDPEHVFIPRFVSDPITIVHEPVIDSDIPMQLIYVEARDGMYAPIGLRKPPGNGPFPFVVFAHMNGGLGSRWIREWTQYGSWTLEQFLKAGYAVAWMRYRAEVNHSYGVPLIETMREGRQLLSRGPLEYDDAISIIKYVKKLPYVDPDRVGYIGLSHGGEMLMKICTEYQGLRCGIASEPASGEYLAARPLPPGTPRPPETRPVFTPEMLKKAVAELRARLDMPVALKRLRAITTPICIQGRDRDHNQETFRLNYELLKELGKDVVWQSYDHPEHGFIFVRRNPQCAYAPDPVQLKVVQDSLAFMNQHMMKA